MAEAARQGSWQESGEPAYRQEATREPNPPANVPVRHPHVSQPTIAEEFAAAPAAPMPSPLPRESAAAKQTIATAASRRTDASPSTGVIVTLPAEPRPGRRVPAL